MSGIEIGLIALATLLIGSADVFGGAASRRSAPLAVTAWSQGAGIPVVLVAALIIGGEPLAADLALGGLAGVGSAVGVSALYRGFAVSNVGIVAPTASTVSALIPIGLGLVGGERPSIVAGLGLAIAILAIALVSWTPGSGKPSATGIAHGVVSGIGFGVMVAAYASTSTDSGIWSAVSGRTAATLLAAFAVVVLGIDRGIARHARIATLLAGVLAALGMAAFVTASQTAPLLVLGVALGMFPTTTVLLAAVFLEDELVPSQWVGIGAAALAVTLITIG